MATERACPPSGTLVVRTPDDRSPSVSGAAVHRGHVVAWIRGGHSVLELGHRVTVERGDLLLVPAGVPHRSVAGGDPVLWGVQFCASCVGLDEADPLMEPFARVRQGGSPVVRLPEAQAAWVEALFRQLEAAAGRTDGVARSVQGALLTVLLDTVGQAMGAPGSTAPPTRVARALAHVWRHALGPLSLRDVAAAVACSPGHLATEVKRSTGRTVGDWIRASRVAAAEGWLLHSDASVEAIGARVGWRDPTHFIRQFRAVTGVTPAAWRRRVREG